jgi:hypothetical protein
MHNGTSWELREVTIGLTIVKRPESTAFSSFGQARIVPAVAGGSPQQDSFQKQPDVTLLLRVKGSAAPSATAIFRTPLNFALFPDQDWHWAIVKAKGIPPQTSSEVTTATQPESPASLLPPAMPGASSRPPESLPPQPVPSPANPDTAAH